MMQNPTISIIVPVYNTKEYLPRCVESLVRQGYAKKEILLVDDGSTDESGAMCDAYAKRYNFIQVLHKENGGLMSAWMAGVNHSSGEYLCFVDSDDWVEPEMLQEMSRYLTGADGEVVVCNHTIDRVGCEPEPQDNALSPGIYDREALEKEVFIQLLGNEVRKVSFSRCMKLIKRELICRNMKFCKPKIRMGEDVNIMLPALLDAERLVIMEKAHFYHYYFNQSSMVHKYDAGLYDNIKLLKQTIDEILAAKYSENGKLDEMRRRADMEYLFLLMLVLKNEARGNASECQKTIRAVCKEETVAQLVQSRPIVVTNKANRLLYAVMKHPNSMMIGLLKLAMAIYYR